MGSQVAVSMLAGLRISSYIRPLSVRTEKQILGMRERGTSMKMKIVMSLCAETLGMCSARIDEPNSKCSLL